MSNDQLHAALDVIVVCMEPEYINDKIFWVYLNIESNVVPISPDFR